MDGLICASFRFAVSDTAYRSLTEENRGQCILISGLYSQNYLLTIIGVNSRMVSESDSGHFMWHTSPYITYYFMNVLYFRQTDCYDEQLTSVIIK